MPEGYKVNVRGASHKHKLPFFCPHCKKITGTIDDEWLRSLGICSECVVMHVDEREKPTIDLSKYAPPGGAFENLSQMEINSYLLNREK